MDDILDFIKSCIKTRKILWTYHINMRLKGRFIPREYILESIETYEIIEEYPKDKYSPSYLIYAIYKGNIFHILIATDLIDRNVRIITAYQPTLEKWEGNFKIRRK